ncbi:MAG TPA: helix-turn-helix domain-containing protein [Saprospiraceae bacterium]|nr:helix-turn-helix domain-containing protein [Saprospiraceae bacterium]
MSTILSPNVILSTIDPDYLIETISTRVTEKLSLYLPATANDRQTDPKKPLRHSAAASYLGIATQTLYQYISEGKIKPHKPGKHNLFYKDDLDAFIRGEQPVQPDGSQFLKRNKKARI